MQALYASAVMHELNCFPFLMIITQFDLITE